VYHFHLPLRIVAVDLYSTDIWTVQWFLYG